MEALPETSMLVLDEAYGELGPASALPAIDVSRPNVVRMRTFSKAYGLAGIRCGYAFGEAQVIRDFEKLRNHYGVSRMAQIAGVEALADQEWLREVVAKVDAGRKRIARIAEDNGMKPLPSATNFVTVDCGRDGAFALKVLEAMLARDVFIRKPMAPGLDRCSASASGSTMNWTYWPRSCQARWRPPAATETRPGQDGVRPRQGPLEISRLLRLRRFASA